MNPGPASPIRLGRPDPAVLALAIVEIIASVTLATCAVAILHRWAPAEGLSVLYLLAVLAVAIRRGPAAALITALVSILVVNFLYIAPRHRLAIAHSEDFVDLAVLMIAAVVVGGLATASRQRAAEAQRRAQVAVTREREATLLAEVASAILAGAGVRRQLEGIGARIAHATGATWARVALEAAPSPADGELALGLRLRDRGAWLYVAGDTTWERADLERLSEPIGRLIDVALERERMAERAAETEASRRADVARTAILHAISHDLRTPLTAITTAAAALRADGVTGGERLELSIAIEDQGARLAKLVDDLLDLSKIEAGAVAPRADWCDLGDAAASAAAQLRSEHPIEFELPTELPLIRADAAQLERVFSNLLANAIRFSPPGVPVRVTAGASAGRVTVRVIDRGRGIPASHRARVFEPFFRLPSETASADGSGSGLGLAICRGFVEANGGRIVLQSRPDTGSSFAVSFPLVVPAAPAFVTGSRASVTGSRASVPASPARPAAKPAARRR